jgi:hypothetical protein
MLDGDWSSDVCSSDLVIPFAREDDTFVFHDIDYNMWQLDADGGIQERR